MAFHDSDAVTGRKAGRRAILHMQWAAMPVNWAMGLFPGALRLSDTLDINRDLVPDCDQWARDAHATNNGEFSCVT